MAILIVPDHARTLTDVVDIQAYLRERGIVYERWEAAGPIPEEADQAAILAAYRHHMEPYMQAHGYQTADVVNVTPNTPNLPEIREKFLKEHTHSEDEVRFFIAGQGYFWFHLEGDEPVFCIKCEAGDLLSVPAGVKHWFDLGQPAYVKAIRIFTDAAGWVPQYTDSGIETRYQDRVYVQ